MYITNSYKVTDSLDTFFVEEVQLCYDVFASRGLYECIACRACKFSRNLVMCEQCRNCSDCFGCYGLQRKQFCVFNQQLTELEYRKFLQEADLGSYKNFQAFDRKAKDFAASLPHQALNIDEASENCLGDIVSLSKNSMYCFTSGNNEDCCYLFEAARNKSSADIDFTYEAELTLEVCTSTELYNCASLLGCDAVRDTFFSMNCYNSSNLFGCVGMKRSEYCILNRQYSRDDYCALVSKIVADMKRRGEWSQFFPAGLSDFGYNETDAAMHYPLNRETAIAQGWNWNDFESPPPQAAQLLQVRDLVDHIKDATDDVLNVAVVCEESGRPFKILPQELAFYRKHSLPLPRFHPEIRHRHQLRYRNPIHLRHYSCDSCGSEGMTTFNEQCKTKLYCAPCYAKFEF